MRIWAGWLAGFLLLASLPASSNYKLNSYGFGAGGTAHSTSTNYGLNGMAGDVSGDTSSGNYKLGAGETREKQADVPLATIANSARWYNKLLVTITPGGNPADALYAIAISSDNFTTTQYIQPDFTIGSTFAKANFLSYGTWGSGSGFYVRGLLPSTVYTVKAASYRGKYTQSQFGPTTNASTVSPQLSFEIDIAGSSFGTSSPPYQINFGDLTPNVVASSPSRVWVSYDTNAESGGGIYVSGLHGGLFSANANYNLTSQTSADLSGVSVGSGLQVKSATQTSGGPLSAVSPYNGSSNAVGIANNTIREIFSTTAPITSGLGSFIMMAKTQTATPAGNDYTEVLTTIAAASF